MATKAVDMCAPSVLREQDQQAAEKERQRKASELAEVNLLYHLLSGCKSYLPISAEKARAGGTDRFTW